MVRRLLPVCLLLALAGCSSSHEPASIAPESKEELAPAPANAAPAVAASAARAAVQQHLADYATVKLTADLSTFDAKQKQMIALLVEAADSMNALYWQQAWGDKAALLQKISDPATRQFAEINYGPWDRLDNDRPFVDGIGARPPGAQFYPADMSKAEFEQSTLKDKTALYTLLRRDAQGKLITVPYHEAYKAQLEKAAGLLRDAAKLAQDAGFRKYLTMRADALLSDDYQPSDFAWMAMKKNPLDIVIGPIETYEDQLFGYKASYEVLRADQGPGLEREAGPLRAIPARTAARPAGGRQVQGGKARLRRRPQRLLRGLLRAAMPTSAPRPSRSTCPNDEQVQLKKGTRRLQLENAMQAKFDKIMLPIGHELIADDQQKNLTFDAFFENTMFHEVAHGLGIKETLDGKGTVRKALKDQASQLRGRQGRHPRPVHGHQAGRQGRAGQVEADGQLRHLPRRHPALGALRRQPMRTAKREHGALQLLQAAGCLHAATEPPAATASTSTR